MNSHERYQAQRQAGSEPRNRARRATKHRNRLHRQESKKLSVPRGHARKLRRRDMVRFKSDQRARLQRATGVIKVTAPSLSMLGQYIGR